MTEYVIEWTQSSRGTVNVYAESEEEARIIFWGDYVNDGYPLEVGHTDWDTEVYSNG